MFPHSPHVVLFFFSQSDQTLLEEILGEEKKLKNESNEKKNWMKKGRFANSDGFVFDSGCSRQYKHRDT